MAKAKIHFLCNHCGSVHPKWMGKCPDCGKSKLRRLISPPVFRLKGSGWYETDFKSDKEGKRNLAGQVEKDEVKAATTDKPAGGAAAPGLRVSPTRSRSPRRSQSPRQTGSARAWQIPRPRPSVQLVRATRSAPAGAERGLRSGTVFTVPPEERLRTRR